MKVSATTNLLARSFLIFIIAWLWTSYYVRGFLIILFISTAITIASNYLILLIGRHRGNTAKITKQQREHAKQVILQLKFMTQAQTKMLLKKALSKEAREHVNQKRFTLCPLFHIAAITEQDIINNIKLAPKDSKIILMAETFPPAIIKFAHSLDFDIVLLDAQVVYSQILCTTQTFPQIKIQTKKATPRKTIREIKALVFNRTRTKSYVITGLVILVSSLIVRLHLYYIIVATIIFALALSSYFSPGISGNLFEHHKINRQ